MDTLHRRRVLDSYNYSLELHPHDGFAGTATIEMEGFGETVGIRAPEGWIITLQECREDSATFSFVAPENELEARQLRFSTPSGVVSHIRIPTREPQRIATEILSGDLPPSNILPQLNQWYDEGDRFSNYDPFIKDCTYMLEFEQYIEVIAKLAEADPAFKGRYVSSHDKWFPNMMLKRRTKYPIHEMETLEKRLDIYSQYDSLLELSRDDVLERYIFKHPYMDNPRTEPKEFGLSYEGWELPSPSA